MTLETSTCNGYLESELSDLKVASNSEEIIVHTTCGKRVVHNSDASLLESLEAASIEVHYHCREGFCGACRTKIHEGSVEYTTDPLAFIDDNEILPCCCKPTTDLLIEIE